MKRVRNLRKKLSQISSLEAKIRDGKNWEAKQRDEGQRGGGKNKRKSCEGAKKKGRGLKKNTAKPGSVSNPFALSKDEVRKVESKLSLEGELTVLEEAPHGR